MKSEGLEGKILHLLSGISLIFTTPNRELSHCVQRKTIQWLSLDDIPHSDPLSKQRNAHPFGDNCPPKCKSARGQTLTK